MSHNENDNSAPRPDQALLAFLATFPDARFGRPDRWSPVDESRPEECPEACLYMRVANGEAEDEAAEELLSHAATCARCGEVLAYSVRSLEGNPSPEEAAAIAHLASASQEWQRKLAIELARSEVRERPGWLRRGLQSAVSWSAVPSNRHRWVAGAAIAAGVLLGVGGIVWQRQLRSPEHQLALAYVQSRTLELRMPGAAYAALTAESHTRGKLADAETASLLEARARLARELEKSPQDGHWLELQARADVLEERYDSAIEVLDRLIAQGPVTAELLLDASTAYYQRGLVAGSELDRSTALDYLRRADEMAPADPVILFNEAVVMEDRGQMMNAVEVWNRYITVERDSKWADEGRRKLGALEQTLNRLRSHQSRIDGMLATPEAMVALANDRQRLASLDEELSSYELDKLLPAAYPVPIEADGRDGTAGPGLKGRGFGAGLDSSDLQYSQQARGSPCAQSCKAARRLLKAIAKSLEVEHHDPWLKDLLSVDINSLPHPAAERYAQALNLLGKAVRADSNGSPSKAETMASEAGRLFEATRTQGGNPTTIGLSARVGALRAEVEAEFALQREGDYRACRIEAQQLSGTPGIRADLSRYPWIHAVKLITEKVCDDTSETRRTGSGLLLEAYALAHADHYRLLHARIQLRMADDAEVGGDTEAVERITLANLRDMTAEDAPTFRIVNAVTEMFYAEHDSPRTRFAELCLREATEWFKLIGSPGDLAEARLDLARAEVRIGAMGEAEYQIRLLQSEGGLSLEERATGANFIEEEIFLANAFLERSDLSRAAVYLDEASTRLQKYSDSWGLMTYAAARGQLELARGHLDLAAATLESEIRSREGHTRNVRAGNVRGGDRAAPMDEAEYAQQDHDLYGELAAIWLAEGRTPESVLALWERFRLRSHGLPVVSCQGDALDCEQPAVAAAQIGLRGSLLTGEIVLLDRVLVYRMDGRSVTWSQKPQKRQDLLQGAQSLERAVGSPMTTLETASLLGQKLSLVLLPELPEKLDSEGVVLLEPDPLLHNVPWPVLPVKGGSLGLQYSLAEMRSIAVPVAIHSESGSSPISNSRGLVVGASMATGEESPLPEAMAEARSVDRFLQTPGLLLGDRATKDNIADKLRTASIFHFAGHAVQSANGTELLLAASSPTDTNPWLDGAFLRQHRPRVCRLAVLSACATGTHSASWSHPLQDMVETLGDLGVPEVVATRWQVDSQASVPFMDTFYRSLAQGSTVAMALTSARRVQFRQSLYKNPYYWGAYYVSGRETTHFTGELHASL